MELKNIQQGIFILFIVGLLLGAGLLVLENFRNHAVDTDTLGAVKTATAILNGTPVSLTVYDEYGNSDTTGTSALVSLTKVNSTTAQEFAVTEDGAVTLTVETPVSSTYAPIKTGTLDVYNADNGTLTLTTDYTVNLTTGVITLVNESYNNTDVYLNYTNQISDITSYFTINTTAKTVTLTENLYNNTNWKIYYTYSFLDHQEAGRVAYATETAIADFPDWFPVIVIVLVAGIILMAVSGFTRKQDTF